MNIYLIGFMSSGKSSVGRVLARLLKRPFVDLDREIEKQGKRPVSEIFREDGETGFRILERDFLAQVARRTNCVVATGGGIVEGKANRDLLRQGLCVFLDVGWEEVAARLFGRSTEDRPLLAEGEQAMRERFERRLPLYRSTARFTVPSEPVGDRPISEVLKARAERILTDIGGEL